MGKTFFIFELFQKPTSRKKGKCQFFRRLIPQFSIAMQNQTKFANEKSSQNQKSLKNLNTKVQQGFQLENYGFQLE